MPNERWRVSEGGDSRKFTAPQVFDQDSDDNEPMTVTKAVGVVVTFVLGTIGGLAFFSFFVYQGLTAVGVSLSWADAVVASVSFIVLRFFEMGISSRLRNRNSD